jgi:DNA-binding transcriptional regulator YiaG
MKILPRKRRKLFVYEGFGFPVALVNVPMVRIRGTWTPDVNYNTLELQVLHALALKPAKLTGAEIHFIRHAMRMTLEQFARRFGVTHPAVIQWEQARHRPTRMAWAIEKDIRLQVLKSQLAVPAARFAEAYQALSEARQAKSMRISVEPRTA